MDEQVFLLLGSNLGNRTDHLKKAVQAIERLAGLIVATSGLYQTRAWGKTDQPDFLNQVVWIKTYLSAHQLLDVLLQIENYLGRVRNEKWEARTIDIDILYYGSAVIKSPQLMVPHPALANRRFTLAPLAEIAPDFVHPVLAVSNLDLLKACPDQLGVERLAESKNAS